MYKFKNDEYVNIDIPNLPHKKGMIIGISNFLPLCTNYIVLLEKEYWVQEGDFTHKAISVPESYISKIKLDVE